MFKTWGMFLERTFNHILDDFSSRLCFACKKAYSDKANKFYCKFCFDKILENFTDINFGRKVLNFGFNKLADYYDETIPLYPKIYFASEYNVLTKPLMRHFKYRKAYISEFWAKLICDYWMQHSNWILADIDPEDFKRYPIIDSQPRLDLDLYISYVPMHETKIKQGRYNQAKFLAKDFTSLLKFRAQSQSMTCLYQGAQGLIYSRIKEVKFLHEYLLRTKNTERLYDKSKYDRLAELRNAFTINPKSKFANSANQKVLIVIDDISTSGATFLEIYKVLLKKRFWDEILFLAPCGRNI